MEAEKNRNEETQAMERVVTAILRVQTAFTALQAQFPPNGEGRPPSTLYWAIYSTGNASHVELARRNTLNRKGVVSIPLPAPRDAPPNALASPMHTLSAHISQPFCCPLAYHDGRRVRVSTKQSRHDRGVNDSQPIDAAHPQLQIPTAAASLPMRRCRPDVR